MPAFFSSFHSIAIRLHDQFAMIGFLICLAGLIMAAAHAKMAGSLKGLWAHLVRLLIVSIAIGQLGAWGNLMTDAANQFVAQIGTANVFALYQKAILNKWGSNGATGGATLTPSASNGQPAAGASPTTTVDPMTGAGASIATISRYGYQNDPYMDSGTAAGLGNRDNQLVQNVSGGQQSIALSPDLIAKYNPAPGATVTATLSNGTTVSGQYDDQTANLTDSNGNPVSRIDIYDPSGAYESINGASVTSLSFGGVAASNSGGILGGLQGMVSGAWTALTHAGDLWWYGLIGPSVYLFSALMLGVMWFIGSVVQPFLYWCAIAVSPLFLCMLMVPALCGVGVRFLLSLAALTLWPVGWAVAGLVTSYLIDLAVNASGHPGAALGVSAMGGPWGIWLAIGGWVFFSMFFAPVIITHQFTQGASGIAHLINRASSAPQQVMMTTLSTASSVNSGARMAQGAASSISGSGGNGSGGGGGRTPRFQAGLRGSYARRPPA